MARKKKINKSVLDPDYLKKQKKALVRKNRQVIYLNDRELSAINQYCDTFNIKNKSVIFRQAIMSKVLSELGENQPTLF